VIPVTMWCVPVSQIKTPVFSSMARNKSHHPGSMSSTPPRSAASFTLTPSVADSIALPLISAGILFCSSPSRSPYNKSAIGIDFHILTPLYNDSAIVRNKSIPTKTYRRSGIASQVHCTWTNMAGIQTVPLIDVLGSVTY